MVLAKSMQMQTQNQNKTASPPSASPPSSAPAPAALSLTHDERIAVVRSHFVRKGYRAHSGLQFGCELVLYADSPGRVHSDFCVHVVGGGDGVGDAGCGVAGGGGRFDWRTLQTLARSMPDLHKTLILANVRLLSKDERAARDDDDGGDGCDGDDDYARLYAVDELAIATEHAPFRHKNTPRGVGTQVKRQRRR